MRPCGGSFETLFRIFEMPCRPGYQILQACSRTIASPFLQPKAFANSALFESGPLPRNLGSGCGLVLAINRAYSIRSLEPQTCCDLKHKVATMATLCFPRHSVRLCPQQLGHARKHCAVIDLQKIVG